jgi:outer membrane protein TolC
MVFFTVAAIAQAPDSLTLAQAVRMALEQYPTITQAGEAVAAAQAHTRGLKSAFLPNVSATVSYANIGPDNPIPGFGRQLFPENNYDGHIGVEYTLFDFGKRSKAVEAGTIAESQAADRLKNAQMALAYGVVQLYHTILLIRQSLPIKDEEIASLQRQLQIVQKKVETGSATRFDVLKTESQCASSQSQRIDLSNDLNKRQIGLRQLLGLAPDAPLMLKSGSAAATVPANADSLLGEALKNRIDRTAAVHGRQAAEVQRQAVSLENAPVVGARATAGVKNGIMPAIDEPTLNWNVGAQVAVPLFDGMRRREHLSEAQRNIQAASAAVAETEIRITTEVLQARADVEAAYAKLDLSAVQVKLAEQALAIAKVQYEAGAIINDEVLDAQAAYAQAQLAYLQNQQRCVLSLCALDQATGRLPGSL